MIWFSPHTICGYATLDTWFFHINDHTMCANLQSMVEGPDISADFDASGVVFAVCWNCNIPVWESFILDVGLCHGRDYILIL